MSLQWGVVAGFLYLEIFLLLILIVPVFRPSTWKSIFNFSLFSNFKTFWKTVFYVFLAILILLFIDSIRTMVKYKGSDDAVGITLDARLDQRIKECRGQRNFYITGFSLFLMFVIYRMISLLFERATIEANHSAMLAQAQNVSRELQRRLEEQGKSKDKKSVLTEEEKAKYISKITELEQEVKKVLADRDTMRKQAESLTKEYDRLLEEHEKLQNKVSVEDKKDQ